MRITKFAHACVRVEHEGAVVVIDPGHFADPSVVDGADSVLITHEHPDHFFPDHLRGSGFAVYTIEAVASRIRDEAPEVEGRVTVVTPGQSFDPGIPTRAVGELHAVIHPEGPRFHNSGYVLTGAHEKLYHPGDALTGPEEHVDVLCVPVSAPWLKASEAVDFARAVRAPRNLAIHDRIYSEAGLTIIDAMMDGFLPDGSTYTRLAEGADL